MVTKYYGAPDTRVLRPAGTVHVRWDSGRLSARIELRVPRPGAEAAATNRAAAGNLKGDGRSAVRGYIDGALKLIRRGSSPGYAGEAVEV